ncbi:biosynthetic-type acetolactate synthase large subunit [Tepidibacter formicigenes]|jgi:acetolactate synthase-1/2/3 large subunit|uniref:Acetolactate synthase n=1 Tax=Tepidibacter formicigenes DSM 15518 TaxID=1123349 RepID=A0A1M6JRR5_9FIRM|nr:biosynthetic-type acetolactate synthase large subunit [Tepidibacter formicigenes]SHJ49326.1 acetolactate synthase, large subunit [Tepidibacter formicigenes DSM 15518]
MNGANLLLECLKNQGVDTLFGYPGGAVIPLYDALYNYKYFKHIRTAHEQGAIHGADGYARSTGKVGVCIATSGPGATNTVTGIATAYMDSVPLVVITGQVSTSLLGKDSFQEIDITGVTMSITKHNYLVRNVNDIPTIVNEAFEVAKTKRPGPILIDIPKDIFLAEYNKVKKYTDNNQNILDINNLENNLDELVKIINDSKRPVIYAGGGVKIANACDELLRFAKKGDIPVVNTLMGLGTIKRDDELSLGLVGMHGFRENNLAVTNSDLVIAIGARFSDRVIGNSNGFAPNAKIIHIDIDATEMSKNKESQYHILGNLNEILKVLTDRMENKNNGEWKKQIKQFESKNEIDENLFHPKNILNRFNEKLKDDVFVVTDVGQHQMWTAQYWNFKNSRSFITSGGLGTMGFGLGAAIGAKVANMDKNVLLVTGNGSFGMNCNELSTVAKYKIPITILLLNNQTLGMVRQWQRLFCDERYSQTDLDYEIDYSALAKVYGMKGYTIKSMDELNNLLSECEFGKEPLFIECKINKDEGVYPIVPPGKSIDYLIEN